MEKPKDKNTTQLILRGVGQVLLIPVVFFATLVGLAGIVQLIQIIYAEFASGRVDIPTIALASVTLVILTLALILLNVLTSRFKDVWGRVATRWQDKQAENDRVERLMQKYQTEEHVAVADREKVDFSDDLLSAHQEQHIKSSKR